MVRLRSKDFSTGVIVLLLATVIESFLTEHEQEHEHDYENGL